jgi:hypothetical protein
LGGYCPCRAGCKPQYQGTRELRAAGFESFPLR